MKRLLSVVLVLLVGVVPVAALASQERVPVEHLLLDVPFGISKEECITLILERAGVELIVDEEEWAPSVYFSSPSCELRICDYPMELWVDFRDDGAYRDLSTEGHIYVSPKELEEGWEALAAKHLQIALAMFEKAEQNFGEAVGGIVKIERSGLEEKVPDGKEYSLPLIDGMPDTDMLSEIFAEDFEFLWVRFYFPHGVAFSVTLSQFKGLPGSIFNLYITVGPYSEEATHRRLDELDDYRGTQAEDIER